MINVLFVCLGNICRSPMAEAMFRDRIKRLNWSGKIQCDSCGTGDYHIGSQPDKRTIQSVQKHGLPISHACRQLTAHDLIHFDYILAMDASNKRNIERLATREQVHKIFLMRSFDVPHQDTDVPDPYYGDSRDFDKVFSILEHSLDGFLEYLRAKHFAELSKL